jgi:putative peptide zinc metalloprotease protein
MEALGLNLKLRSDLIVSRQTNEDGLLYVIKDPNTDRFFRFKEIENYIAQQLDGNTSPEVIIQRVEEKFGVSLSEGNLAQFTKRLQIIGLLTDQNSTAATSQKKGWQLKGDIFYLRGKLFNPDRFFDWLHPKIEFLFTPAFVITSAVLVMVAVGITISNWSVVMHEFAGLLRIESLLQAYIVMLVVVFLHEFAHGLTCKHFGGHVREIGFMFIYFQPAFFCNVSDAWLFPNKAHRMWVTFAGAYFEIFLWALATITWRITDPSTSLNHFALVVTATSAFKMFFNMNPLIKLDGYYLLCDWLDIPNLRQKASDYFNSRVKRLFGFTGMPVLDINPRLRNFFIVYSVLSALYIYWILSHIAWWFGDVMVRNYQGWGFTIFATTLAVLFRKPLGRVFAPVTSGMKSMSGMIHIPNPLKWFVLLAGLLAALILVRMQLKISGPFVVLPQHNADIRAEAEGIIEQIYVNEGDAVKAGTLIARLSDRDYNADLRKTQADIEAKEAELRLLESGAKPEEIEIAKAQIPKLQELVTLARNQVNRDQSLVDQKYISVAEFEDSKEQLTIREKELEEAQGKLKLLQAGNSQEVMEAMKANIRSLEAQEKFIRQQLASLEIVSPIDGVVTTHKLKEKKGENVKKGDLVAEVYAMKFVNVEMAIPENEIGEVQVGQPVILKARAHPGETFEGKVIMIAPVATKAAEEWINDRTVLVTTQLDNTKGLLKPEMTGNGKIYCGEYRVIDLLTRRLVRYFRVEFWSWW